MKKVISILLMLVFFNVSVYAQPGDRPDLNSMSPWAKDSINTALELNIINPPVAREYQKNITRAEFVYLCTTVIYKWVSNSDIDDTEGFKSDEGFPGLDNVKCIKELTKNSTFKGFDDYGPYTAELCGRLGIISGVSDGIFAPDREITREEAARMLYNTLDVITPVIKEKHKNGDFSCCAVHKFDDSIKFKSWSRNEINHIYRLGIMLGVGENNFEPEGNYTREQAYCTFLRLYYACAEPEKNILPKPDIMFAYEDLLYYDTPTLNFNSVENADTIYEPLIIDSNGKHYSKNEKGWLPEGMNFAEVIDAAFPGVHSSHIIDNEGHIMLKNVAEDGSFYETDVRGNTAAVVLHSDYYKSYIYNLITGDLIVEGSFEYSDHNKGLYKNRAVFVSGDKYGLLDCENGSIVIPPKYKHLYEFYNDLSIAQKNDNTYSILDITGREIKSFKLNFDVLSAKGTNMICKPKDYNNGDKYFVYRAYSGKKTEYFSDISFEDYEIIALKTNPHNYFILNSDCSVKKDCKGYTTVKYIGCGIYSAYKDNGEKGLVDIINKDGNVIMTDVPSNCRADESGIISFSKGEENPVVMLYDFSGDTVLSHTFDNYETTGFFVYNPPLCYFANGAVYIPNLINKGTGENEKLLLMPNGVVFK